MITFTTTINNNDKNFVDKFCKQNCISRSEVIRQCISFIKKDSSFIDLSKTNIKMMPDWLEDKEKLVHDTLEGMIFSDCHLEWVGRYPRIHFCQTLRNSTYVDYIAKIFDIEERVSERHRFDKRTNKIYSIKEFKTLKSKSLIPYYERWYTLGKKNIPEDFKITPNSLLHRVFGRWISYY